MISKIDRNKAIKERDVLNGIKHYSRNKNNCKCCKDDELTNLTFDHINPAETSHIKPQGGTSIATRLRLLGWPPGFQILCLKCNSSKNNGKKCRLNHKPRLEITVDFRLLKCGDMSY